MYLSCTGKKWISFDARRWSIFPKMVTYTIHWRHLYFMLEKLVLVSARAVRYHSKFAYYDTIVLVSWCTLGIDTLHDMVYIA